MKTRTKGRRHSAAFKAKVGMEAVLGVRIVARIAREYSVHPVQVSQWKAVIRDRLPEPFEAGRTRRWTTRRPGSCTWIPTRTERGR